MTKSEIEKFRTRLRELAGQVQDAAGLAEDQARQGTGGEVAGGLSNAPVHLGDLGTETANQELGATILENEQYLQDEVAAALERVEQGPFGQCEECGRAIAAARIEALPYARYCIDCARQVQNGPAINMNEGRPASWESGTGLAPTEDRHAAGTPGGGTAVGGLAGTPVGDGDPSGADLEAAMGNGTFDAEVEGDQNPARKTAEGEDVPGGYAGQSGGAVGGTPANKRASGGKRK
jgi:RNA polymerase-binding transcription factor DksA